MAAECYLSYSVIRLVLAASSRSLEQKLQEGVRVFWLEAGDDFSSPVGMFALVFAPKEAQASNMHASQHAKPASM